MQTLKEVTNFFSLGNIINFKRASGKANLNYYLETDCGSYFVKFLREYPVDILKLELEYLNRLEQFQFEAAYPIRSPSGSKIFQNEDETAVAYPKLPGKAPALTPNTLFQIGAALGKLHQIPTENLPAKQTWLVEYYAFNALEKVKKKLSNDVYNKFSLAYDKVNTFHKLPLQRSIIHGDIHPPNMLFNEDKLVAILDWEEVSIQPSIIDIAFGVLWCCYVNNKYQSDLYNKLIDGYQASRELSQLELDHIPDAVRYVGFVNSIWLLIHEKVKHPELPESGYATMYWDWNLEDWNP